MPNFKGKKRITLQPNDTDLEYQFEVTVASNSTSNDGAIGYGRSVSSVTVSAHKDDGTAETGMPGSASLATNVITLPLSYPSGGAGKYHIRFICTLDDSSVKELDFNRVVAVDL